VDTRLAGKAELTIDFSNFSIDGRQRGAMSERRQPVTGRELRSTGDQMRTLFSESAVF